MSAVAKALAKRGGAAPKRASGPDLPAAGAYLWAAYCEASESRAVGMGFGPISETDLFFFAANRNFRWQPWELKTMRALDRAHRVSVAETQKAETKMPVKTATTRGGAR